MKKDRQTGFAKQTIKCLALVLVYALLIFPVHGNGQNSARITLTLKNTNLKSALTQIQEQSTVNIAYADRLLDSRKKTLDLSLNNLSVNEALTKVLGGTGLTYRTEGNNIILYEMPQQRPVTGVVYDQETGETLPGVSVTAKLSGNGVSTDIDGGYAIQVLPNDEITFKMIGFEDQTVSVTDQNRIEIQLEAVISALDEVVVVGYGTQRKVNLTGSVSTMKAEDFESRPIVNVNQAMQGQMPGVTVVNSNARPGTNNSSIRIRGVGTLNNASALVIVDGLAVYDMSIINPEDIESMSVLKDAASASIYGVRGANGVILITTKKGRASGDGRADITYSGYYGVQTPTALPEMASSADYMELMNEALINGRSNPSWTDEQIRIAREGSDQNYYANTNWIEEIYKDSAPQQKHNLSVNGGMGKSNYYLAYGYLNQGGMITGDNFNSNRHNIRLRVNTTLFDRLSIDGNVGYVDRNYLSSSENTANTSGPLNAAMAISPLVPVRFTTGGWGYHGGQRNPIAMTTDGGTDKFDSQEFTGNLQANLEIIEGLNARVQFGQIRYHTRRTVFDQTVDYIDPSGTLIYQNNNPNKLEVRSFTRNYMNLTGLLDYEKTVADDHYFKALLGASQEDDVNNDLNASRTHLAVNGVPSLNVGTQNQLNSNPGTQWALQSFFGRLNYSYKERYLLEGNFRRDGSSRFSPDLRWDWFSAISAGWVFSQEPFFEGLRDVVDLGKIRFSYGTQGNDKVGGDFDYLGIYDSRNTMPIGNQLTLGYSQPDVANRLLTWESMVKKDIGIDLSMFNSRLNITADYFKNETNDILLEVPLPDVLGVVDYPVQNAGNVENEGWEFQVGWQSQVNEVRYGVSANLSDVKNKVTGYGGAPPIIGDRIRRVGDPIDAFYGLVADRIAQEADFDYNPATSAYIPRFPHINGDPISPGDIIYKVLTPTTDVNKPYDFADPEKEYISLDKDREVIGSAIPRLTYGFKGDVAWKGLDFSFFLQGVGKADGLLTGQARHALISNSTMPQKIHLDRWTPENPDASYPRLVYNQSYNTRLSTYWLQDASYLRLKNVQLGYTLPQGLTNLKSLGKVRVYASAENLLTSSDFFYGFDPEVPVSSGGIYPQVKTFIFGISINLK